MHSQYIKQQDQQYIAQTYQRFDLVLEKGQGCNVWDREGNRYLDFTSGIGTNSLGWAEPSWVNAVIHQAGKLQHVSNLFYTSPAVELGEKLTQRSGLKKVFFCNSGAEANEGAIKVARKYSVDRYGEGRSTILTLQHSFHGRTISTLAATGQPTFHQFFFPFTAGFEHFPANNIALLEERLATQDVCAIMLEIIQGEGGILLLDNDYLQAIQTLCQRLDILLIIDEVQTGIGRTGKFLAYQHFNLQPDIVTLAKGLGGGLPIGAILLGEKCATTLGKGEHGSTFGGNPVCCAAANAVLDKMTPDFIEDVAQKGKQLHRALTQLPNVQSVSGLGLMLGVEFQPPIQASDIVAKAIQKGLLTLTAKHKLRLLPPLIIRSAEIEEGIAILSEVLAES